MNFSIKSNGARKAAKEAANRETVSAQRAEYNLDVGFCLHCGPVESDIVLTRKWPQVEYYAGCCDTVYTVLS